jgi:hypothetical protein
MEAARRQARAAEVPTETPTEAGNRRLGDKGSPGPHPPLMAPMTPGRDGRQHRIHCPTCGVDMRPLVRRDGAVEGAICCSLRWRWVWNEFLPDGEA